MKVLVVAYCNGNLGDDLFVYELCRRYPEHSFYLVGKSEYKSIFSECTNLHYVEQYSRIWNTYVKIHNKIRKLKRKTPDSQITSIRLFLKKICDVTVLIGGSVFIQNENWKLELCNRKRLFDKNSYWLGCNYRLGNTIEYQKEYSEFLKGIKDICFRDKASYGVFKDNPNARLASDILFGVDIPECSQGDYYIISAIDIERKIEKGLSGDKYYCLMAECAKEIIKRGYNVLFFSFCEAEGDMKAISTILSKIDDKEKITVYNHDSISRSLEYIANCRGIITARFHGMVLGIKCGKQVYPMIYSDKTLQVLKDIEYSGDYCYISDTESNSADKIFNEMDKGYTVKPDLNPEEHFKMLDKVLV